MIPSHPPDNLPVEPLEDGLGWHAVDDNKLNPPLGFRWGRFRLTTSDVTAFRYALEEALGHPLEESDEELELMAYQFIEATATLIQVAKRVNSRHKNN